jgi:hypothetical protein
MSALHFIVSPVGLILCGEQQGRTTTLFPDVTCPECLTMINEWSYEPPNDVNEDCARGIEP